MLKKLFDYHRFDKNKQLQSQIDVVNQKYDEQVVVLDDAQLSFAIGGTNTEEKKVEKEDICDDQSGKL